MIAQHDDTIAAFASAASPSLRGILRISGPAALAIVARALSITLDDVQRTEVRTISLSPQLLFQNAAPADAKKAAWPALDLYLWPTNASYTKQPLVELHTLGSLPLLELLLRKLIQAGARQAQPGEFTLRAFLAGRIDLLQAEAVLGVIDAADQRQFQTALQQLAGGLSQPLQLLRDELLNLLADLEAGLDFVDEDISFVTPEQLAARLQTAAAAIQKLLVQMQTRHAQQELPRVVLWGAPQRRQEPVV